MATPGAAFCDASGYMFETCCNCGTVFAMTRAIYEARRNDLGSFFCPNGHSQHYTGLSLDRQRITELEAEVARQKRSAERERKNREWAESRAKGANIAAGKAKAQLRRTVERVHAGTAAGVRWRSLRDLARVLRLHVRRELLERAVAMRAHYRAKRQQ